MYLIEKFFPLYFIIGTRKQVIRKGKEVPFVLDHAVAWFYFKPADQVSLVKAAEQSS